MQRRTPLSQFLRFLAGQAGTLPKDKIDLVYVIRELERALPKPFMAHPKVRSVDDMLDLFHETAMEEIGKGQTAGPARIAGLLEITNGHFFYICVYLTLHLPSRVLASKFQGVTVLFRLACLGANAGELFQSYRKALCVDELRSLKCCNRTLEKMLESHDLVLFRMHQYEKTDRRLDKLFPRSQRHPVATFSLYSRRWWRLCQDVAHLLPDFATHQAVLDEFLASGERPEPANVPPDKAEFDVDPFAELRRFGASKLKGIERRVVELVCDAGGKLSLADLAIDEQIKWILPCDDTFNSARKRINAKMKGSLPWRLNRRDSVAFFARLPAVESRTKKS